MPCLADILAALNLPPTGDPAMRISGANSLADALPTEISFLAAAKHAEAFTRTRAGVVLVQKSVPLPDVLPPAVLLSVESADLALACVLELLSPPQDFTPGVHSSAVVDPTAAVDPSAHIAAQVLVGRHAVIGAGTTLLPGAVVGDHAVVGRLCVIHPHVTVGPRVRVGDRVILHSGVVLGADGFGYRWDGRQHTKIPQIGTVLIEEDVEIGANTCVDRAKFASTVIGRGTKIDNLVQVGHNCRIGPHNIIVAGCMIGGSVTTGAGVMIGGAVAVKDNITIGAGVRIAAGSGVVNDVEPGQRVGGFPAQPIRITLRELAYLRRLPELFDRLGKS